MNIAFINEFIDFLKEIKRDREKVKWCDQYSAYVSTNEDKWGLNKTIWGYVEKAYDNGLVPTDYREVFDIIDNENLYTRVASKNEMESLSLKQLISIIAMEFRHDHFCEGVLINKYIARGILLFYMENLKDKIEEQIDCIKLNDLLGFSEEEMKNCKIRFNQTSSDANPMELYLQDPEMVNNQWFLWRKTQRYFSEGQIALCLLKIAEDTWLLTTIKKIVKDLDVINGINYDAEELEKYKKYYGRVIIKFHKTFQSQGVFLDNIYDELVVNQILTNSFDGFDFPGYDKVRISFDELNTIIQMHKRDWIAALENQKAVYLITDKSNGKLYVGSATSNQGMLLARWKSYAENGHGGNIELIDLIKREGIDYVRKNFQYSILENYNSKVDDSLILNRESWWKETLQTRKFGYNSN